MFDRTMEKPPGFDNKVTFNDADGKIVELVVNGDNCGDVLCEIMTIEQKSKKYDYDLRIRLLDLSQGKLETWQVFTKNPDNLGRPPDKIKDYLDDPNNWLPERIELHENIIRAEFEEIVELSKRLGHIVPTIYILRGNTASGKTTALGSHVEFEKVINPDTSKPDGVINPDKYKAALRKNLSESGCTASHGQVHIEGAVLKRALCKLAIESRNLSFVRDERFSFFEDILDVELDAKMTGRIIRMLDLDVPLEVSLLRVLARDVDGEDPVVKFDIIADGFVKIRIGRENVIGEVNKNPDIQYYLLAESSESPIQEVVEKKGGVFQTYNDPLFQELLAYDRDEIDKLSAQVIDETYIDYVLTSIITDSYPEKMRDRLLKKLSDNLGKTLFEAMSN